MDRIIVRQLAEAMGYEFVDAKNMDSFVNDDSRINYYYTSGTLMKQFTDRRPPIVLRDATLEELEDLINNNG